MGACAAVSKGDVFKTSGIAPAEPAAVIVPAALAAHVAMPVAMVSLALGESGIQP